LLVAAGKWQNSGSIVFSVMADVIAVLAKSQHTTAYMLPVY
jgi:hypothetical protein